MTTRKRELMQWIGWAMLFVPLVGGLLFLLCIAWKAALFGILFMAYIFIASSLMTR